MKKRIRLIAGALCLLAAVVLAAVLNAPTEREQVVTFASTYGDKAVMLEGSYWAVENAEYAALICPGYSCDRQKWRPMADLLVSDGVAVMSFDYAGQGASSGTIGFDNAKTDKIPVEINDAIAELMALTGLPEDHIILVGHSMGGRAILRLLCDYHDPAAQTTIVPRGIRAAILLSPEVNYRHNAQASLFAGTSDAEEEPWLSYDGDCIGGTEVWLFGSTADDIVADEDVLAMYRRLGGTDAPEGGVCTGDSQTSVGTPVHVAVTSGVLHSYEMYSPRFGAFVNDVVAAVTGHDAVYEPSRFLMIYGAWALGLAGLFLILGALNAGAPETDALPVLTDAGRFLRRKALLWLPGLLISIVICCLCVAMPFGSPVMNIPYMTFIAGYGVTMLLAWRKGRFPGTEGCLPKPVRKKPDPKKMVVTLAVTLVLCYAVQYIMRATMYRLIPMNARLFWVVLAAFLMSLSFYISGCEVEMLRKAGASWRVKLCYNLIQYVPLFLLIGFYLVLKSYSGMIGQAQNMVLMYMFCIPLGSWLRMRTGSRMAGALMTAFLFQTIMITSAALIAFF